MLFVPHILIVHRFSGAMMSLVVAVPIGMTLLWFFTSSLSNFPGETIPDLMRRVLPKWVISSYVVFITVLWYLAGAFTLLSFAEITKRFLSPESSQFVILLLFVLLVVMVCPLKSKSMLHGLEVLFVFNTPIIALILLKSTFNQNMEWNAVFEVGTNLLTLPDWSSLAAATYIFSGYANLVMLNDSMRIQLKKRHYLYISIFGAGTLLTSFFIPIGLLGTYAVDRFVFPWVATADSIAMEYFFIERMLIPFLLLYLMISLVSAVVHWHVSYRLFIGLIKKPRKWTKAAILCVLGGTVFVLQQLIHDEHLLFRFANLWMQVRLVSEIFIVVVVVILTRRLQK